MCDCLSKIEDLMREKFPQDAKGRKIESYSWKDIGLRLDGTTFTYSIISQRIVGVKKANPITIQHLFCPFCGERMDSDSKAEEVKP